MPLFRRVLSSVCLKISKSILELMVIVGKLTTLTQLQACIYICFVICVVGELKNPRKLFIPYTHGLDFRWSMSAFTCCYASDQIKYAVSRRMTNNLVKLLKQKHLLNVNGKKLYFYLVSS